MNNKARDKELWLAQPPKRKSTPKPYRDWMAENKPKSPILAEPDAREVEALRMMVR